ncbi:hypothetical protein SELMODRAFT_419131 [Selaginella moellendorffii]|uniref:Uncharacterized protein n=1 Tax=Selaginella moellendorffii TaxID=88036 RepID=D8S7Y2_SELML|nr:hypothetical protein SELMODRAFT_419131 [Selaginella moellendorffii]
MEVDMEAVCAQGEGNTMRKRVKMTMHLYHGPNNIRVVHTKEESGDIHDNEESWAVVSGMFNSKVNCGVQWSLVSGAPIAIVSACDHLAVKGLLRVLFTVRRGAYYHKACSILHLYKNNPPCFFKWLKSSPIQTALLGIFILFFSSLLAIQACEASKKRCMEKWRPIKNYYIEHV